MKKIVLNGFKSFYTRTQIDFSDELTCIVGPNGCGKSNILDAVRWVLGEQSAKQLRGGEISDVISAGNARRAQKNRAEAYLTFTDVQNQLDTQRDEIEVGRMVNRDGEGTYLLNGDEVRLKDIQDLFRDTGIGQELYSMIGQGEVIKLINSKPEERREIIEEAAGISTFRHRRDLTRRRLKQTREELEMVEKELREKKGRLSQLMGQAEQAEKVQSYQRKLRDLKIERSRRKFIRYSENLAELKSSIKQARGKHEQLKKKKSETELRLERFEQRLEKIQGKIQEFQEFRKPLQQRRRDHQEAVSRSQTRRESVLNQMRRTRSEVEQKSEEYKAFWSELKQLHRNCYLSLLRQNIADQTVQVLEEQERSAKRETQTIRDELEGVRSQSLFEISEESEIKHRLQSSKEQLKSLEEDRSVREDDLIDSREKALRKKMSVHRAFQQIVEDEAEWVQLRLENQRQSVEFEALSTLSDELNHALMKAKQNENQLENHRNSLRDLVDRYEGYYPGVQALMSSKKGRSESENLYGVLADFISVESEYQTALEAVLEREIQAIVVEERQDALDLIEFLKNQQAGRARFFSLQSVEESDGSPAVSSPPIDALPAREVVQVSSRVDGLIQNLLEGVYIVEDLENALQVQQDDYPEIRILVTCDGDILDDDGSVTGGTHRTDRQNLLNRGDKLERLGDELSQVRSRKRKLSTSADRLDKLRTQSEGRSNQIENALEGIRLQHRENQRDLERNQSEFREASNNLENGALRLVELIERRIETIYEIKALKVVRSQVSGRETKRRQTIQQLRARLSNLEDRLDFQQAEIRQALRSYEESSSRIRELENRIEEIVQRRGQTLDSLQNLTSEIRQLRQDSFGRERERVSAFLKLNRLETRIDALEELENHWNKQYRSKQQDLRSLNRTLQEFERKSAEAQNHWERLKRERENERTRLNQLKKNFKEEYDIELRNDDLPEPRRNDLKRDELGKEIRRLQGEIRSMQPVNMLAKKERNDLQQEVQSVEEQKNDLEESCDKLDRMIRRLNDRARNQFQDAFEEICGYFEDFVQELFNGGQGKLELTDDPVLDAGVLLEIQPPGEKLKSMSALSGGEKSLTALAFLFALFERKATPFAFLDEVDAPFDDENVTQFIDLINRYSDRTQFVIITHNKSTMQAASQLYGVTMEESGVSSLVSVELEEAESLREEPIIASS